MWLLYAILSSVFAALTSILAKYSFLPSVFVGECE